MKPKNTSERIYLDYAAATPIDGRVAAAMDKARKQFANPSAIYAEGRAAREAYQLAKKRVGMVLGVKADEIVFTSGATESDNLAILGAVRPHMSIANRAHIITIPTEHQSVLEPIKQLEREGATVSYAKVDSRGVVDLADLKQQIGDRTVLVSIAYASSEIGTIQSLSKIGQLIARIKKSRVEKGSTTPLLLHSDCSAAAGQLPLSPTRLGLDLLSLNASKIYGPHVGILFVRRGVELSPLMFGGGQQGRMRPGSEDLAGAVGFETALEIAEELRPTEYERLVALRDDLRKGLEGIYPGLILNGDNKRRLVNNLNVTLPGLNGEDLAAHFDAAGFAVATGAACAAADEAPSHVLLAIGLSEQEAQSSLRITLGRQTTRAEITTFLQLAKQIVSDLAKM